MTRRLTLLLLVADLLLALLLAALWLAPGPAARWRDWQPPAPQPPNLNDARTALITRNQAAAAEYPDVLERPLLLPARRPDAAASDPASAAPPPTAIEQVKFTGIVAGPTLTGVLLEENGQPRFVRQGEAVGDWILEAIDGRAITFKRGAEHKQVSLPYADMATAGKDAAKSAPGEPPRIMTPAPVPPSPWSAPTPPAPTTQPVPPRVHVPSSSPTPSVPASAPAGNLPASAASASLAASVDGDAQPRPVPAPPMPTPSAAQAPSGNPVPSVPATAPAGGLSASAAGASAPPPTSAKGGKP